MSEPKKVDTLLVGAEQARLLQVMEAHNSVDQTYVDEGIRLLELLNFLLSNSTWGDGTLSATFPTTL